MNSVGIKDLKANLSRYVARAKKGQQVMVTERGEPVAVLGPVAPEVKAMLKAVREGRATWSGQKPVIRPKNWRPGDLNPDVAGAVMENRDEEEERV